jgi:hypothetical protein
MTTLRNFLKSAKGGKRCLSTCVNRFGWPMIESARAFGLVHIEYFENATGARRTQLALSKINLE